MTTTVTQPSRSLILLVDDVPVNLQVLAAALKNEYRIKTATSGRAALEQLAKPADQPELVLLDVMMPDMSGIEVLRRMREDAATRSIPVVFVSGDTSESSQIEGLELGADDYITKPIAISLLKVRVRNLLARHRAERQLQLAAHVFDHSGEAILITDRDNRVVDVNAAFTRLTGYTIDDVRGQPPSMLAAGKTPPETYAKLWQAVNSVGFWQGELWDRDKNGRIYPKLVTISVVRGAHGAAEYYIANFTDISERKAAEDRIQHLAHHDALTGLANRLRLSAVLEQFIATARRESGGVAVMLLDLDRFKIINDTLGHDVGDGLLIEVARRIGQCVRGSDLAARMGGDEFVVALQMQDIEPAAAQVAAKLLEALSQPYRVAGHELRSTPSMGVAIFPQDGADPTALLKSADTAMYHAKSQGRGQYHFYTEGMNRRAHDRMAMENALHRALDRQEFILHYQPQAEVATGRLVGAEALLRWHHPERGLVPPNDFIPLAEDTGLIVPIGEWVLREACRQMVAWQAAGLPPLIIAINLSARQFRQEDLADRIGSILAETGVDPAWVELEITESMLMDRPEVATAVLHGVRERGMSVAIDDFGTGYSSLGYLKHFPVNKLKIDRSFVSDIPGDANDAAIAAAVIRLADTLGLKVVAEGVETAAQRDFLDAQGCGILQGFWYSRPLDAAAFERFHRDQAT